MKLKVLLAAVAIALAGGTSSSAAPVDVFFEFTGPSFDSVPNPDNIEREYTVFGQIFGLDDAITSQSATSVRINGTSSYLLGPEAFGTNEFTFGNGVLANFTLILSLEFADFAPFGWGSPSSGFRDALNTFNLTLREGFSVERGTGDDFFRFVSASEVSITGVEVGQVPLPSSAFFLFAGLGVIGVAGSRRRKP